MPFLSVFFRSSPDDVPQMGITMGKEAVELTLVHQSDGKLHSYSRDSANIEEILRARGILCIGTIKEACRNPEAWRHDNGPPFSPSHGLHSTSSRFIPWLVLFGSGLDLQSSKFTETALTLHATWSFLLISSPAIGRNGVKKHYFCSWQRTGL